MQLRDSIIQNRNRIKQKSILAFIPVFQIFIGFITLVHGYAYIDMLNPYYFCKNYTTSIPKYKSNIQL